MVGGRVCGTAEDFAVVGCVVHFCMDAGLGGRAPHGFRLAWFSPEGEMVMVIYGLSWRASMLASLWFWDLGGG
jgi:hypothetical protein